MKIIFSILVSCLILSSCDTDGVKKKNENPVKKEVEQTLDGEHKVLAEKKLAEGISIQWYGLGDGEKISDEDLVMIDYKVKLKDGTVVDGNHLLKKEALPYLVGFELQPGWDIAFRELKVGDFVRIIVPSKLSRDDKGIEGLIPPNADNLLFVRILRKQKPNRVVEGTKVWLLEENPNNKLKFNEKTQITMHAMVSSPSNPLYVNTFRSNQPFSYKLSDHGLVPGLRKALINAKKSDRMYIVVPASEAYGSAGYLDIVKPGESLFYNVLVMDVAKI